MSLKSVFNQLKEIRNVPSTNEKVKLLEKFLQDNTFRKVIELTYDGIKHFNVKGLYKKHNMGLIDAKTSNKELFDYLEILAEQRGTTNEDKQKLTVLASMDIETYEVVKLIINKDVKCGFSGKLINKAYPGLIKIMPYCRCSTFKNKGDNINFEKGAIIQEKADGSFVNIIISENDVKLRSRNGSKFHQLEHLQDLLNLTGVSFRNTVFMGELLVFHDGEILQRKTGNGILNSCIQGTANEVMAKKVILKLWDVVPLKDFFQGECKIPYTQRLARADKFVKYWNDDRLSLINTKKVFSLKEANQFYAKMRKNNKEGAIIKNLDMKWKNHTSPDAVKLKNIMDVDLKIVNYKQGKKGTRFSECMGAIICESSCGKLSVSIGTGFSDKERLQNWAMNIGKIVTIACESIISDKSKPGKYSLYLPRYIELRPDRNNAQSLKDIQTR